jgi:hypothetical protein
MAICRVQTCEQEAKAAFTLCWPHYRRFKKYGDPQGKPNKPHPYERVLRRVDQRDVGCWLYDIAEDRQPRVYIDGRRMQARWAVYEWLVGQLDPRARLVPKCGNQRCVRPDHHRVVPPVKRNAPSGGRRREAA